MKKTQLNALGAFENLELFDKNGNVVYKFLTYNSEDCWIKFTYNENGNQLTFEDSTDYWSKRTYDEKGNELTFEDSTDCWWKRTYDEKGNQLTYESSSGRKKGFDIPEFTMEELVKKIGYNFKIKK
jgi:hypothetical protein